jgi:hypothetical protein
MSKVKDALTRKIGPLPAYAWLGIFAVGLYLYRRNHQSSSTSSATGTATPNTADVVTGESVYPQYSGDGSGGGGYSSGGGSGSGDTSAADTSPATIPAINVTFPSAATSAPNNGVTRVPTTKAQTKTKKPVDTSKTKTARSSAATKNSGHTTAAHTRPHKPRTVSVKVDKPKASGATSKRPAATKSRSTTAVNTGRVNKVATAKKTATKKRK